MKDPIYPAPKACFLATILFFLITLISWPAKGAGVTIITHGFELEDSYPTWVTAMANQIPNYASFPGSNFTIYKIIVTHNDGNYNIAWARTNGSTPAATDSGEIIVELDWSQLSSDLFDSYASTYDVADAVSWALMQTNLIAEFGGHALVELPIHLVGHSRGASLMSQISYILGTNGIWVDHLTTLDPHPVNNDGNVDFASYSDASAENTYVNVLFHDNYWQDIGLGLDLDGEYVSGAYNRQLFDLSGGYNDSLEGIAGIDSPSHSNVHLWYQGTVDLNTPTSDTGATITSAERMNWWVNYEQEGTNAGFEYSLIGHGNRISTDQPLGQGFPAIVAGYNQNWDLGGGTSVNRTALPVNNGTWPNIIKFNITGTNVVTQGNSISTTLYYQYGGASNLTLQIYLDQDFNPYNSNSVLVLPPEEVTLKGTGVYYYPDLSLTTKNVPPGIYSVYAQITDGMHTRYLYAPEQVEIVAFQQAPNSLAGNSIGIDITGGTSPFATNGNYFFLPASAGDSYQIVGLDNVQASSGTYSYSSAGAVGTVSLTDSVAGSLVGTLNFSTAASGGFYVTNAGFSAYQTGNFEMFSGQALNSIAGQRIECTIQEGSYPFANTGTFVFQTAGSGNSYAIIGDGVNTANSLGTYSYSNINASTGVLEFDDSLGGAGSAYMAFSTLSSGEFAVTSSSTNGFQIATFVIADTSSSQVTMYLNGNLAFGNVAVGSSAQSTLTILNAGNSPLTVTNISYPTGFSGNWSGTIPAGASQPVTVTFSPTAATIYGVIATVNADNTIGVNLIPISGIGVSGDSTLTIVTNGDGAVSPNLNGKLLNPDKSYTLTAVPGIGDVFSNWSGSITTNKNPITFKAGSNMVFQANFIPNPFLPLKGTYDGLFFSATDGVIEETAGMLKGLTVGAKGTYSGTILINGGSHAVKGAFDLSGQATNEIKRPSSQGGLLTLAMTLVNSSNSAPQITGTISGSTNGVSWEASLLAVLATNTLPPTEYIMLIQPDTNNAPPDSSPGGDGYALITNHMDTAKITGALADGTAFSQSVPVSQDGYIPLYANLYAGKGLLLGWINLDFTNTAGVSLTWIRPKRVSGLYTNGFTNVLPAGQIPLSPWTNLPPETALAGLTNLFLLDTICDTNAVSSNYAVPFAVTNIVAGKLKGPSMTGTINAKTGLLKVTAGTGVHKVTGYGAILLDGTNSYGGGYFQAETIDGAVILAP